MAALMNALREELLVTTQTTLPTAGTLTTATTSTAITRQTLTSNAAQGALSTLTSTAKRDGSEVLTLLSRSIENDARAEARDLVSSAVQQGVEQAADQLLGNTGLEQIANMTANPV